MNKKGNIQQICSYEKSYLFTLFSKTYQIDFKIPIYKFNKKAIK